MRNQKDFHYLCINCLITNSIFDKIEDLKISSHGIAIVAFKKPFLLHCCVRICVKLDLYQMETQEAFFRLKSKPLFSNQILKISYEITIVTYKKNLLVPLCTLKSLTSEAIPSTTQFFKRAYKISHFPGL